MSSLRNSLHRRNHKERSQLSNRARLGILEKHKDYVQRARDYHSKQDRIRKLKERASARNKDEFYFGMKASRTRGGVHVKDRGNAALPVDLVKVLKSQDDNYLRSVRNIGRKKIEQIKSDLTALADLVGDQHIPDDSDSEGGENGLNGVEVETLRQAGVFPAASTGKKSKKDTKPPAKHVVFVENADEARTYTMPSSQPTTQVSSTVDEPVDLGWEPTPQPGGIGKKRRREVEQGEDEVMEANIQDLQVEARKHRTDLLKELAARLERDTALQRSQRELEMQRMLMGKGARKKVHGVERIGTDNDGDEDEEDSRGRGKKGQKKTQAPDMAAFKPRVYKFRAERKT